jgi:hypothetical protein
MSTIIQGIHNGRSIAIVITNVTSEEIQVARDSSICGSAVTTYPGCQVSSLEGLGAMRSGRRLPLRRHQIQSLRIARLAPTLN